MVEHKVGELVLMAFTVYDKPVRVLGVISKIEDVKGRAYRVDWFDGSEQWHSSATIEEFKCDLWSYLES